jgi:competence protein ComEC
LISFGLTAFLLGLVLARWQQWHIDILWVLAALSSLAVLHKRNTFTLIVVLAVGLIAGVWRGAVVYDQIAGYKNYYNQKVSVSGAVLDDPVYDDEGRLDFRVGNVSINGEGLPGQVRVRANVNDLRRGDEVNASAKLLDGFGNYQAAMSFAEVEIIGRSDSPIESIRREFFANVYSILPEPHASLGLGFLVGLKSALPDDINDQLKIAGLTHIVVASGYNLTVLVRLCRRLLAKYSKYQALAGSIALIFGFLAVTGASTSMVRASVVTLLSLWAWYYGRKFHPVLILLLGAALTAGYTPLYIWYDLGWWLSFLAFAGVLIVGPLITVRFWRNRQPPLLAQVAIETTAAQMMAMPLIMFTFGNVSLVALFANIAVVPFIPFAMVATFVAGISGAILPEALVGWLAMPAQMLLSYIISVTQLFAAPTWAQASIEIDRITLLVIYVMLLILVSVLYDRSKLRINKVPSIIE